MAVASKLDLLRIKSHGSPSSLALRKPSLVILAILKHTWNFRGSSMTRAGSGFVSRKQARLRPSKTPSSHPGISSFMIQLRLAENTTIVASTIPPHRRGGRKIQQTYRTVVQPLLKHKTQVSHINWSKANLVELKSFMHFDMAVTARRVSRATFVFSKI